MLRPLPLPRVSLARLYANFGSGLAAVPVALSNGDISAIGGEGGGGEVCGESGGSGVRRRRTGGSRAAHAGARLQVFACDGSGGEAASATLAQPARPDSRPPTPQPSTEEEGGCRLRGGPGSERPPCGVSLGKAWREADSGAWKSGERAGRGRVGKGQASRGSRRPGPGGGRGRAGPWCGAAA